MSADTITATLSPGETTQAMRDDAPATRPMTVVSADRIAAALDQLEPSIELPPVSTSDPCLATGEPTIAEAARLLDRLLASGSVARLDLAHDALTVAFRRGRAAERRDVNALAVDHAEQFANAVRARAEAEALRHARPWSQQ